MQRPPRRSPARSSRRTADGDYRTHVAVSIQELSMIERAALPAYADALRRTDLEPTEHQLEIRRAGQRLDYLLELVDKRLGQLWHGPWFGDRVVAMLLTQLDTLKTRAARMDERAASLSSPVVTIARGTPAGGVATPEARTTVQVRRLKL